MSEIIQSSNNEVEIFKDAIMDDSIVVQLAAIKRLNLLARVVGVEITRDELIPVLDNYFETMHDELYYNLAEQLDTFVPLVGGGEHVGSILNILAKMCTLDEVMVRARTIDSMRTICGTLNQEQCENLFYPLIQQILGSDWFTNKSSASALIEICYTKVSTEKQTDLRNIFRNIIQDDSPIVRRAAEGDLAKLIQKLNEEEIKSEFVPVFDNLAIDDQDSVRVLSVEVGIAIAKKLKDFEIYEFLIKTFCVLSVDASWRVRQIVALKLNEILSVATSENSREELINMYQNSARDTELEVRVIAAKTLYDFSLALWEIIKLSPNSEEVFEKIFIENILPEVHFMIADRNREVRVALSTTILSLSGILRAECFNTHIVPLVINALENEDAVELKENILKNLNSLPAEVDISKSLKSIDKIMKSILENSQLHWRSRRSLLIAILHISNNCDKEFFDENLKIFYLALLNDTVFAIRRTAPLILPLLVKRFGMHWAKSSLLPIFVYFSKDSRYLFRYNTLHGIDELLKPTLEQETHQTTLYLTDFKQLIKTEEKNVGKLAKIVKLTEKFVAELDKFPVDNTTEDSIKEDLTLYAEDTLETLKKSHTSRIFSLDPDNPQSQSYLEGLLIALLTNFMDLINDFLKDPTVNIQTQAKYTLGKIKNFSEKLQEEVKEDWVKEAMGKLSEEELKIIDEELSAALEKKVVLEETEEIIDPTLVEEMVLEAVEPLPELGGEIPELEENDVENSEISNVK